MAFQREVAHRLFAREFNASRHDIQGQGEKDPSYVVSPLGAKVNRLHVVGVCTDIEPVGESGELYRARVSDPTGQFTVYAGQYQPEAAQVLSQLQPPQFIAVTGKARAYEPEPGSRFMSIRPETITVVDPQSRDRWVLDTVARTKERLAAMEAAREDGEATAESLASAGHPAWVREGAILAREPYGMEDLSRYRAGIDAALAYLRGEATEEAEPAPLPAKPAPVEANAEEDALDDTVLAAVKALEGDDGARWDDILERCGTDGTGAETVEESLNRLMDKGLVYEPTLGVLKTT